MTTITETVLPTIRAVSNPFGDPGPGDALGFVLPTDDTHFRIFTVLRATDRTFFERIEALRPSGEPDFDTTQRFPGDWEAMRSQGPITLHSEEHLATSDKGVRTLRRFFRDQMAAVARGEDPVNAALSPGADVVPIRCGQFFDAEGDASS